MSLDPLSYRYMLITVIAHEFLRCFYESFRRLNQEMFNKLSSQLYESAKQRFPLDPMQDCCGILAYWIENGS